MTRIGTSDLDVFPLCFGGNVFGWTADRDTSFALLDSFTGSGGNFIDTADAYSHWIPGHSGGESETILGEWLAERGNRSSTIIATKVGMLPGYTTLDASTVTAACENSLRRLRTDYIDLYYCHIDDAETPLEETLGAMGELVRSGKVRYIAASNYSPDRLTEALRISDSQGLPRFIAVQPQYNLLVRDQVEGAMAQVCSEEGIGVLPYYPLGAGFLTGKYRSEADFGDAARATTLKRYTGPRGWAMVDALVSIADRHGVTPTTIALAWVRTQPTVVAPIASASRLDQLPALLASVDITLTDQDLVELDVAYATPSSS